MKKQQLSDAYRFKGFVPEQEVHKAITDVDARVIRLKRRQKKQFVPCVVKAFGLITIVPEDWYETCRVANFGFILMSKYAV